MGDSEVTDGENSDLREHLLRAQMALINARSAPIGELEGEICEAKGYVDLALKEYDERGE